jgi:endoglucanase
MDTILKTILDAPGISGYESSIAAIMQAELKKACGNAAIDGFGNVSATKGSGKTKIMLAAHMDEIGLMVKCITKEGYLHFIKIGGIDDRVLPAQRVIVRGAKGDLVGIIGTKPPHLQQDEERKKPMKYEDMFIDIGAKDKKDAEKRVAIGDPVIFEPNAGVLNGDLCYGKAVDNRIGCYALIKIMEKLNVSGLNAQVIAVATTQEEVGLKGARTSSFAINPDFALAIDTTIAGDTPGIKETESPLKLGAGVGITFIEASGRGVLVREKTKNMLIKAAKDGKIKYQLAIIEGGMTDGAIIYMNNQGINTGVISIPTRYIHSPSAVFSMADVNAAIALVLAAIKVVGK